MDGYILLVVTSFYEYNSYCMSLSTMEKMNLITRFVTRSLSRSWPQVLVILSQKISLLPLQLQSSIATEFSSKFANGKILLVILNQACGAGLKLWVDSSQLQLICHQPLKIC